MISFESDYIAGAHPEIIRRLTETTGYGLMSKEADLTIKDIADLCDVFYIGGTKVGALCGEAVVFTKGNKPKHFITSVKRRGALILIFDI